MISTGRGARVIGVGHALQIGSPPTGPREITLVHVSQLPPNLPPERSSRPWARRLPFASTTTRPARLQLEDIAEPLRREGIHVRTLAVTGDAAEEILAASSTVGADATVVGMHGRSGLSHLLLGSVAEKVVRRSPVPVVSVRSQAQEATHTHEENAVEDELAG